MQLELRVENRLYTEALSSQLAESRCMIDQPFPAVVVQLVGIDQLLELQVEGHDVIEARVLSDRDRWGPEGLEGGEAGGKARYILDLEGRNEALGSKVTIALAADTVFSYRTCGGGGYGPPQRREVQAVVRDLHEGKVSLERARTVYGVVIDERTGEVDREATQELREAMEDGV